MYFVILDSTANLVDSFTEEAEGRHALEEIVRQDPESASEYALLTYDDAGRPTGASIVGSELNIPA